MTAQHIWSTLVAALAIVLALIVDSFVGVSHFFAPKTAAA